MILASFYILCYILSMATYVLDYKTARIFGEVKNARVSGQTKRLEREGQNAEWDWAYGCVRLARFSWKSTPALRVFAKQIMKKKNAVSSPVYIRSSASESRKKDVITLKPV